MSSPAIPDFLADKLARYASYKAAEVAVLAGQSYSIGGRSMVRANLHEIRDELRKLEHDIYNLSKPGGPGIKITLGVPV
jgi:hypothetical protein